jgi:hypothetical protein
MIIISGFEFMFCTTVHDKLVLGGNGPMAFQWPSVPRVLLNSTTISYFANLVGFKADRVTPPFELPSLDEFCGWYWRSLPSLTEKPYHQMHPLMHPMLSST